MGTSLQFWRDHLFSATIIYLLPIGLLGFIPGLYLAVIENLVYLVIADIIGIISLLVIAFLPGLPVYYRKLLFIIAFYNISLALLIYLGLYGPGMMFLVALTVFIVLILDRMYGILSVVLNTFICIFLAIAIHFSWWDTPLILFYDLQSWIAVSSNLLILSVLSVILIPRLFNGLQETIEEQQRLKNQLESKQKELQKSHDLLSEKNEELENFAMVASHDLKEPLRMISSFMQLLENNYTSQLDERANKYIHFAVDGARRMTAMIEELLNYSRIGRMYTEITTIDTNELVDNVVAHLKPFIEEKGAFIEKSDLPHIQGIPVALKMLFQNLLENALKYSKEGVNPEIFISGSESDEEWLFRISDNGMGIEEEYQDQIFLMFKRLHSDSEIQGSGMGLALCKKIVEQHGGEISVQSVPDKGSAFTFTLKKID